jgi:hypothetical protein
MPLSPESIIGLLALLVAFPPTAWSLYMLHRYLRRPQFEGKYDSHDQFNTEDASCLTASFQ